MLMVPSTSNTAEPVDVEFRSETDCPDLFVVAPVPSEKPSSDGEDEATDEGFVEDYYSMMMVRRGHCLCTKLTIMHHILSRFIN